MILCPSWQLTTEESSGAKPACGSRSFLAICLRHLGLKVAVKFCGLLGYESFRSARRNMIWMAAKGRNLALPEGVTEGMSANLPGKEFRPLLSV